MAAYDGLNYEQRTKRFFDRQKLLLELGFKFQPKSATRRAYFTYYGRMEFDAEITFNQADSSFRMDIDRYKNKIKELQPIVDNVKRTIFSKLNEGKISRTDLIDFINTL